MDLICPQCHQPIGPDDYNVGTDIAYCRLCDTKYSLATLASVETVDEPTYNQFEHSCCQEFGREASASVPFPIATRIVGFALILGSLVMLVVFGILAQGEDAQGLLIFALVFGGCAALDSLFAFFFLAGKYAISLERGLLRVRAGVFPFRRSKQIELDRTTKIYLEKNNNVRNNGQPAEQIAVETDARKISFGVMMNRQNKACVMRWLAKHIP